MRRRADQLLSLALLATALLLWSSPALCAASSSASGEAAAASSDAQQVCVDGDSQGQCSWGAGEGAAPSAAPSTRPTPAPTSPGNLAALEQLESQLTNVTQRLAELQVQVADLQAQAASHAQQIAALQQQRPSVPPLHHVPEEDGGHAHGGGHVASSRLAGSSGGSTSAWLDHFLMLALLRPPEPSPSTSNTTAAADPGPGEPDDAPSTTAPPIGSFTSIQPLSTDPSHAPVEKPPRYLLAGCGDGALAVFSTRGALLARFETGSASPVTALASYGVRRNETAVLTGHLDGELRTHALWHWPNVTASRGSIRGLRLKHVLLGGTSRPGLLAEEAHPIARIVPIRPGSRGAIKRTIAVWDARGWMRLVRDNGTVRVASHSNRTLLASQQNGLQLISLSSTHALVHRQHQAHPHKVVKCQHLNGTRMLAAAFDPVRVHRAYAVNDAGQLLLLSVPYDNKLTSCKVARAIPLPEHLLPAVRRCHERLADPAPHASAYDSDASTPAPHLTVNGDADPTAPPTTAREALEQPDTSTTGPDSTPAEPAGDASEAAPRPGACLEPGSVSVAAMRGYVVVLHPEGGMLFNVSALRMMLGPPLLAEPWTVLSGMLGLALPPSSSGADAQGRARSTAPLLALSTLSKGMLLVSLSPAPAAVAAAPAGALPAPAAVVAVLESELPVPKALQQEAGALEASKGFWAQPLFIGLMMLVGFWQFTKARNQLGAQGAAGFSARRASALDDLAGMGNIANLAGFGLGGTFGASRAAARRGGAAGVFGPAPGARAARGGGGGLSGGLGGVAGVSAAYQDAYDQLQRGRARAAYDAVEEEGEEEDGMEEEEKEDYDVVGVRRGAAAGRERGRAGGAYGGGGVNLGRPPANLGGVADGAAYAGYPGPRSMQRGLRMGVAPILHDRREGAAGAAGGRASFQGPGGAGAGAGGVVTEELIGDIGLDS